MWGHNNRNSKRCNQSKKDAPKDETGAIIGSMLSATFVCSQPDMKKDIIFPREAILI